MKLFLSLLTIAIISTPICAIASPKDAQYAQMGYRKAVALRYLKPNSSYSQALMGAIQLLRVGTIESASRSSGVSEAELRKLIQLGTPIPTVLGTIPVPSLPLALKQTALPPAPEQNEVAPVKTASKKGIKKYKKSAPLAYRKAIKSKQPLAFKPIEPVVEIDFEFEPMTFRKPKKLKRPSSIPAQEIQFLYMKVQEPVVSNKGIFGMFRR